MHHRRDASNALGRRCKIGGIGRYTLCLIQSDCGGAPESGSATRPWSSVVASVSELKSAKDPKLVRSFAL